MGQGWPTGVWAQPPRGFPGQQQQSEYLAIEVTHLVQWNVLGSPIEVDHLLIWHRLQAPGWAHRQGTQTSSIQSGPDPWPHRAGDSAVRKDNVDLEWAAVGSG